RTRRRRPRGGRGGVRDKEKKRPRRGERRGRCESSPAQWESGRGPAPAADQHPSWTASSQAERKALMSLELTEPEPSKSAALVPSCTSASHTPRKALMSLELTCPSPSQSAGQAGP